jgi:hypothetical protein
MRSRRRRSHRHGYRRPGVDERSPTRSAAGDRCQQGRHRWSLTDEHLNVAFRFGQGRRSFQCRQRTRGVAAGVGGERLHHQDLDHAARSASPADSRRCSRRATSFREPLSPSVPYRARSTAPWRGALEFADVPQVVVHGQSLLPGPAEGFADVSFARPARVPAGRRCLHGRCRCRCRCRC